jgi:hypothetical protein
VRIAPCRPGTTTQHDKALRRIASVPAPTGHDADAVRLLDGLAAGRRDCHDGGGPETFSRETPVAWSRAVQKYAAAWACRGGTTPSWRAEIAVPQAAAGVPVQRLCGRRTGRAAGRHDTRCRDGGAVRARRAHHADWVHNGRHAQARINPAGLSQAQLRSRSKVWTPLALCRETCPTCLDESNLRWHASSVFRPPPRAGSPWPRPSPARSPTVPGATAKSALAYSPRPTSPIATGHRSSLHSPTRARRPFSLRPV